MEVNKKESLKIVKLSENQKTTKNGKSAAKTKSTGEKSRNLYTKLESQRIISSAKYRELKAEILETYDVVDTLLKEKKSIMWASTSPDNIRSTHHLFPFRTYKNNSREASFEFFLNTTGLRDDESRKIIGDVIDEEIFDAIDKANPLGDIGEIFRKFSVEQHRMGVFARFGFPAGKCVFKVEVPLIFSLNHLWLNPADQKTFREKLSENSGPAFFTDEEVEILEDLATDLEFDTRVGDLRLALQCTPFKALGIEPYFGFEVMIPIIRAKYFDEPKTELTYPQNTITLEDFINQSDIEGIIETEIEPFDFANRDDIYQFLFDTLTVLRKTQFSPQGDTLKFGGGAFFGANARCTDEIDFFLHAKINYLLGGVRYRIIPVEEQLVPSEFRVQISPVTIMQGSLGFAYTPGSWSINGGYDFYFKTLEGISNVEAEEEALRKLDIGRAEIPQTIQHKLFGGICYRGKKAIASLGGDYTMFSEGTEKEWSIALSVSTEF
ncbi:hypothetical protein ACFLY6_02455 [Candidatus Dependentiae bacterium]